MITLNSTPQAGAYAGYAFIFIVAALVLSYCCAIPNHLIYLIYPGVKMFFNYFNVQVSATTSLILMYFCQMLVWVSTIALIGYLVYASFYLVLDEDDLLYAITIFFVGMIYFFTLCSYFSISKYSWMGSLYSEIYSIIVVLSILGFILAQLFSFSAFATEYLGNSILFVGVSLIPLILTSYDVSAKSPTIATTGARNSNSNTVQVTGAVSATGINAAGATVATNTVVEQFSYAKFRVKIVDCISTNSDELKNSIKFDTSFFSTFFSSVKSFIFGCLKAIKLDTYANELVWFLSWIPIFWFSTVWWYNPFVPERRGVALAVFIFIFMTEVLHIIHNKGFTRNFTLMFSIMRFLGALFGSHYWLFGISTIIAVSNFYFMEQIIDEKLNFQKQNIISMIEKFDSTKSNDHSKDANIKSGALTPDNTNKSCYDQYFTACSPCSSGFSAQIVGSCCLNFWCVSFPEFLGSIIPALQGSKMATAAVINAIFIIIFIIGWCDVDGVIPFEVMGRHQGEWACLILLSATVLKSCRIAQRLIKYFGMASSILGLMTVGSSSQVIVASATGSVSTSSTTAATAAGSSSSVVSVTATASTSDVTASIPTRKIKQSLIGLSLLLAWISFVCLSCLAAHLSGHWGIVPCVTIIPLSLYSFYNFIVKWEKDGCVIPSWAITVLKFIDTWILEPLSKFCGICYFYLCKLCEFIYIKALRPALNYCSARCSQYSTCCKQSANSVVPTNGSPSKGAVSNNSTTIPTTSTTTTNAKDVEMGNNTALGKKIDNVVVSNNNEKVDAIGTAQVTSGSSSMVQSLSKQDSVNHSIKNLDEGGRGDDSFYYVRCFVSSIIRQMDTLWFSCLLLIGSVAFSLLTIDFYAILYFGLWMMSIMAATINIIRWRSKLLADTCLWALVVISWCPTIAWSIVAGIRNRPQFGGHGVVVLMCFGSSLQLAIVSYFILRDFNNIKGINNASSTVSNTADDAIKLTRLRTTVVSMYSIAVILFFISLIFFIVFVNQPLGVAFLLVFVGAVVLSSSKLGVVDIKADNFEFSPEIKLGLAVVAIVACGALGAVSFPSKAFWWASLSWLFLSCLPFVESLRHLFSISLRVYGPHFYPIFKKKHHGVNSSIEDASFEGSCFHIFLFMVMLWGIFSSVVLAPRDLGIVVYVVSLFVAVFYSFSKSSNTILLTKISEFKATESEILVICNIARREHSGEPTIPLAAGQVATKVPVDEMKREIDLYLESLAKDVQTARANLAALDTSTDSLINWSFVLSSVPLFNVFYSLYYFGTVYKDSGADVDAKIKSYIIASDNLLASMKVLQRFLAFCDILMYSSAKEAIDSFDADCITFLRSNNAALKNLTIEQLHSLPHEAFEMAFSKFKDYKDKIRIIQEKEEADRREQAEAEARRKKAQEELRLKTLKEQEEMKRRQETEVEEARRRAKIEEEERLARIKREEEEDAKRRKEAEAENARAQAAMKAEQERIAKVKKAQEEEERRKLQEEEERRQKARKEEDARRKAVEEEEARRKKEAEEEARRAMSDAEKQAALERHKQAEEKRRALEEEIRRQRIQVEEEAHRIAMMDLEARKKKRQDEEEALRAKHNAEIEAQKRRALEEEERRKDQEAQRKRTEEELATKRKIANVSLTFDKNDPLETRVIGRNGVPQNASFNSVLMQLKNEFTDSDFPNNPDQLGKKKADRANKEGYEWSRIQAIDKNVIAGLRDNGLPKAKVCADNVVQGSLGDCYLLSALAALAERPNLVENLFPGGNPSKSLYSVRLYFNKEIQTIVLDDYFVSLRGSAVFSKKHSTKSTYSNSLWVMLLEKAYAKLYGDYTNIEGGFVHQALADLTGGIPDLISDLKVDSNSKWNLVFNYFNKGYLLGAGSRAGSDEHTSDDGIVFGHAYAILNMAEVDGFKLMLVRNPWGRTEWKGRWSDGSSEWTDRYTTLLKHTNADDGKFWIEWNDFITVYRNVYICKLFDESFPKCSITGSWNPSSQTAGGCKGSDIKNNPQFLLKLESGSVMSSGKDCDITVMLSISETETMLRDGYPAMGIYVLNKRDKLTSNLYQQDVLDKSAFEYSRDIVIDFKLNSKNPAVVLPCTYEKNKAASFTITAYNTTTKEPISIKLL